MCEKTNATVPDIRALDRECTIYMRYLVGGVPDRYVLDKYRHAHQVIEGLGDSKQNIADRALIVFSSSHRLFARLVDVYTRIFYPTALVRKKWTLLLSILECSAGWYGFFDIGHKAASAHPYLGVMSRAVAFLFVLSAATALLLPIHMGCAIVSGVSRREL